MKSALPTRNISSLFLLVVQAASTCKGSLPLVVLDSIFNEVPFIFAFSPLDQDFLRSITDQNPDLPHLLCFVSGCQERFFWVVWSHRGGKAPNSWKSLRTRLRNKEGQEGELRPFPGEVHALLRLKALEIISSPSTEIASPYLMPHFCRDLTRKEQVQNFKSNTKQN